MEYRPSYEELLEENLRLKQQLEEKKHLEKELKKTQILMKTAFDQSPVPLIVTTFPDLTFKIINKATEDFLLLNASDYLGKVPAEVEWKWREFYPDGSSVTDISELPLPQALNGVVTKNKEMYILRHDGSVVWELASASPVYDDENQMIGAILAINDITARKETEQALALHRVRLQEQIEEYEALNEELNEKVKELVQAKEIAENNEKLYQKLINNSPMGMHFYRLENNLLIFSRANPAADKMLKVDNSIFIGKTIEDAFPPLAETEIPERYREAAQKGINWRTEQIIYEDQMISGAFEVIVFQTLPGNMVAVFNDITERKLFERKIKEKNEEIEAQNEEYQQINEELLQTNQELLNSKLYIEKSEEKFRLMIKNSTDGFVLVNKSGEQFYVSDAASRDTGFTADELKGSFENYIHPDDRKEVYKAWVKLMNIKNEVVRVQYRHKHKTKDYIWVEVAAQNYLDNPVLNAVVSNFRDITALKETQDELIIAKEKAEENDRLKTAFLQNMSHEIRTPMNAIMGFSGLLLKNFDNREKLESFVKIIELRCNDLLDIINDILDISKIESGQSSLELVNFNLKDLFSELELFFNEFKVRIHRQNVKLEFLLLPEETLCCIKTDKLKLKQIMINLISNSLKFTETGSIICGFNQENDKLRFFVKDTGIGIPLDKHEFIFERFTQLKYPSDMNLGGTGLGLPIVKGLVRLLGGNIWLESDVNKGTTFYFTIKYSKSNLKKSVKSPLISKPEINKGKSILIVEDDVYNAEYLKEILNNISSNIYIVSTGMSAVKFLKEHNIDLVLMDVRLPDISGYEATRLILQEHPKMKIIAQTAYAANIEHQNALDAGCIDYISKPIREGQLYILLNKYLK